MEYARLGRSGLEVSRLCLGTMGFGTPQPGGHQWVVGLDEARTVFQKALELGINFFDTANVYSAGTSEEVLGTLIKEQGVRDDIVLATKVHGRMHDGPNGAGLSRKAITRELDASLRRLGTDYIDLYIIHRWDYQTPIEETLATLDDAVTAGKVRYLGASAMYAWQFQRALHTSEVQGWNRFVSMQDHYNLMYREEEREMLPLCQFQGVGSTPYSPLASGRLTRDRSDATSKRATTDAVQKMKYDKTADQDDVIVQRVAQMAKDKGVSRAAIALAWLLNKPPVVAPIIGGTKESHLTDAVEALDVRLTKADMESLEEPYVPHGIVGHSYEGGWN